MTSNPLKKIFSPGKAQPSSADLKVRHDSLVGKKSQYESEAAEIRRQALTSGDIESASSRLLELRTRVELCDAGMEEIREQLLALETARIEREFAEAEAVEKENTARVADLIRDAGKMLGIIEKRFRLSGKRPFPRLAARLQEAAEELEGDPESLSPLVLSVIDAYHQGAGAAQGEFENLKTARRQYESARRRVPGSEAAVNHVRHTVDRILNPPDDRPVVYNTQRPDRAAS